MRDVLKRNKRAMIFPDPCCRKTCLSSLVRSDNVVTNAWLGTRWMRWIHSVLVISVYPWSTIDLPKTRFGNFQFNITHNWESDAKTSARSLALSQMKVLFTPRSIQAVPFNLFRVLGDIMFHHHVKTISIVLVGVIKSLHERRMNGCCLPCDPTTR